MTANVMLYHNTILNLQFKKAKHFIKSEIVVQFAMRHALKYNLIILAVFKKNWFILILDLDLRQTRCKPVI